MAFSNNLKEVLNKSKKTRQVGETKIGTDGITRIWTDLGNGNFNWRRIKEQHNSSEKPKLTTTSSSNKTSGTKRASMLSNPDTVAKLKENLKNSPSDKLVSFCNCTKEQSKT